MNAEQFLELSCVARLVMAATRTGAYVVITPDEAERWLCETVRSAKREGQPPLANWDEKLQILTVGGSADMAYEEVTP